MKKNYHMDRREAIKRAALLVGGSILMPDILKAWTHPVIENKTFSISFLQEQTLAEVCETIIPTTNTPGAKAAGVPDFIKKMLADCYEKPSSDAFMKGLDKLNADATTQFGKSYADIAPEQRIELLKAVEKQAYEDRKAAPKEPQFFFLAKELTVIGYFTSEIGCTQALRYEPVPGRYDGALPYKKGDKAWAT
jgi:Gluconate 2-dehydrogenase subunit 3